jgi:hypothetical protein
MRRLTRAKQPRVAVKVIVEFDRADDSCVHYCTGRAISATVGITPRRGEKHDLVLFSNDNEGYLWFEAQLVAGTCSKIGSWGHKGGKRGKVRHTSDEAELFIDDGFEFTLGDAVCEKDISWVSPWARLEPLTAVEKDALGELAHRSPILLEHFLASNK